MVELTSAEILSWGKSTAVLLYYFHFSSPGAVVLLDGLPSGRIDDEVGHVFQSLPMMRAIFNAVAGKAGEALKIYEPFETLVARVGVRLEPVAEVANVGGRAIVAIEFTAEVSLHRMELSLPTVRAFRGPEGTASQPILEEFDLGATSVIHSGNDVACIVDLTPLDLPPFSLFKMVEFKTEEERNYASLELVGLERTLKTGASMSVNIQYLSEGESGCSHE